MNGIALQHARKRKEDRYAELCGLEGERVLVVIAGEVGGRWSRETQAFLQCLAHGNGIALQHAKAFATSLLEQRGDPGAGGHLPSVHEVLADVRREV